jgi:ATP-dependent helicase IRC3
MEAVMQSVLLPAVADAAESPTLELRPYQLAAIEAVRNGYRRGLRRMLVQLATGLGKTVVFSHLAHRVTARGGRALIIAHRDELLTQAREKLLAVDPLADVGIVRAEWDGADAAIVVASIQTIARPERLGRLGRFELVVIDEAHHAAARSYRDVLEALGAFEDCGPTVLGVTATPGRGDGVGLDSVFDEIVYRMSILDGITAGYLCDLRAVRVGLATSFDGVRSSHGDLENGALGDALLAADAPEHVARAYLKHADGRRAIIFAPTVAVARAMADALQDAGVPAAWVSGTTPRDERAAILEALRSGQLQAVANAMLLTEGFDCPPVDCVITARPTKSSALYAQMVGRGTRLHPGKADCLILDVVGQAGRHDLVTAAELVGVDPRVLAGRTAIEAVVAQERLDEERATRETERAIGRLASAAVELFGGRALRWERRGDACHALPVPQGQLVLTLHRDGWTLSQQLRGQLPRALGRGLDLATAREAAERQARELVDAHVLGPDAAWRRRPVSEKQVEELRRLGLLPIPRGTTRGQAADLITAAYRRPRRRRSA